MAPVAADRFRGAVRELAFLLEPRPGRIEFALRIALICALTAAVAEIYHTFDPALTIYVAFFLNQKERATSLLLEVGVLAIFTILEGLILLIAIVVLDDPMWRFIAIAVGSFSFLFVLPTSKLRELNGPLALILGYALDELGLVPVGDLATRALLYAWLLVGIPAGVSIVVNLVLGRPPRRLAERTLADALRLSARMLRLPDERTRRRFAETLRSSTASLPGSLRLAGVEHTVPSSDLAALQRAVVSMPVLMTAIDTIDRYGRPAIPAASLEAIARTLDEMAAIFERGRYPVDTAFRLETAPPTDAVAARALNEIEETISSFTTPVAASTSSISPPAEHEGFIDMAQLANPDSLRYALKTTAAAMTCYLLYTLLDWPGIHTCFITCYIVSLGTTAETIEKLSLRIVGCLIGAAAGLAAIVYLLPLLTSIGGLMIVVFLATVVSAYIVGGSPRIAYAGFQIAYAFYLCLVQGDAPAFDLTTARDRVIGILVGNIVSYLIFTQIWPVSVSRRIDPAIASLLRRLGTMASKGAQARAALLPGALAQITAIEQDLQLARYESAGVSAPAGWLAARRTGMRALTALLGPLVLMDKGEAADTQIAARLDAVARRASGESAANAVSRRLHGDHLSAVVDRSLHKLERSLARAPGGENHATI